MKRILVFLLVMHPTGPIGAETVRVPVSRDTWFSGVGREADCNLGGAHQLKLKSIQEMSLVDFDPAPLKGRVVRRAILHIRLRGKEIARRVTVGSFSAEWVEGTSPSYEPQQGSSTFNHRRHPDVPWTWPGSDLTAVILGQGGSLWNMGDASAPDADGWQEIPIDPRMVAARVAEISYGLFLFDDTGTEWIRNGEQFKLLPFPNRFFHSRDSGKASSPYLSVELGDSDVEAPPAPGDLKVEVEHLPAGEARLRWTTPEDAGSAGTIGYYVEVDGRPVPRYLIPPAESPGTAAVMHLRDIGLAAGAEILVTVRAVDAAGNVGAAIETPITVSSLKPAPLPGESPDPFSEGGPLPQLGKTRVAILDALDKVHPISGEMIPQQPPRYLSANHLWSANEKQIRLAAARNEHVAMQILFEGAIRQGEVSLDLEKDGKDFPVEFSRFRYVPSRRGPLPDPIVPLVQPFNLPDRQDAAEGQTRGSLLCEVYVPHDAKPGPHRGSLRIREGDENLSIAFVLWVWDFTLPDCLSFLPEMNCYGLPANERDYYRLAHRHRTVLNRLAYSHRGTVAEGCAPQWDGHRFEWSDWDKRFGPYLDGSAFTDLPRRGVPVDCFYLPLHENWPVPMEGNYNGDYWADRAFSKSYREAFVDACRQTARHFEDRGWHEPIFQFYLNNKNQYKERGWSKASSPWLLDEPANFQDYWALRYFGEAFHGGIAQALGGDARAKLVYRCDISRPQWQRDSLDHVLDYNVVGGGPFRRYHRVVLDRKAAFGQIVVNYGTTNAIEESNLQPVGWCIDSWTLSSDGVVPWQTIGNAGSWKEADQLSLFYPGQPAGQSEPVPSIRLKAYCRGQQDAEYLTLLAQLRGEDRWMLGESVRRELKLAAEHRDTGFAGGEDAGVVHYAALLPQDVWALRIRVARAISDLHPTPKRRLIDFRTPRRQLRTGIQ